MPADYPPNCVMSGFVFVSDTLQKDIDPAVVDFVNNDPLAELSGGSNLYICVADSVITVSVHNSLSIFQIIAPFSSQPHVLSHHQQA
jgi:hypothetical protein